MIGVVAKDTDHPVVTEFFQLFKTHWEFWLPERTYEVLLCCETVIPDNQASLVVAYTSEPAVDFGSVVSNSSDSPTLLVFPTGERLPVYGNCLTFGEGSGSFAPFDERTKRPVAIELGSESRKTIRVGYDLCGEIRSLLTEGQPLANATSPSVELHISFLRSLIVRHGSILVEIPPAPVGYPFIACLTHDVDHIRIRPHKLDHTMFGFLYRATLGSFLSFVRGRQSVKVLATNLRAACSLPFVYLGLAKDFWDQAANYLALEKGVTSTFFVIPTKGEPGVSPNGEKKKLRATRYDVGDIGSDIRMLLAAGREVGLHGIDAWRDSKIGRDERKRIQEATGSKEIGVRMHWLFFGKESPKMIEQAGFAYDSTVGYNERVGYRAGTSQVFGFLEVDHLLELPMHIMDTALFYPSYMDLTEREARLAILPLVENAERFGGVVTVNWHDRSIGPERLWRSSYKDLLATLRAKGAWFGTAAETVSWFRKRRSSHIESVICEGGTVRVKVSVGADSKGLPGLRVRIHNAPVQGVRTGVAVFTDFPVEHSEEVLLAA
ncbi:MAG: hypothetical protein H0V18_06940 [Pyrinomonadaceae bacterium]|nr:hypothetical protein [Pyrinomonadaceae bacterium]